LTGLARLATLAAVTDHATNHAHLSPPSAQSAAQRLDAEAQRINFAWLLRLRWGAVLGQLLTILLVTWGMDIALPLPWLLSLLSLEAASNVACMLWARRRPVRGWAIFVLMNVDVLLLTALLFLTGGPFNPFSFLYLVHIALAAVVLPASSVWSLVVLSVLCFGSLFVHQEWMPHMHMNHADQMRMHMQGMWIAFVVAAGFITYFVTRVRQSLTLREAELVRERALTARSEKLASLATLATGAAHELATPLSTIAVVAKELSRSLAPGGGNDTAVADAHLIRREVERCREILRQMAADAGQHTGEAATRLGVRELVDAALDGLPLPEQVRVTHGSGAGEHVLHAQPNATAQALRSVLKNAIQASPTTSVVEVHTHVHDHECVIEVRDEGKGMSDEVQRRAGEPFFTTKEPGEGMGLGLFLTRIVLERIGGSLELRSTEGRGTTALVRMPLAAENATNGRTTGAIPHA
jgi:two-component system sensor histidine kinase RegB